MNRLEDLRKSIDEIDEEIIKLLIKRKELVEAVAEVKKDSGMTALQPDRFRKVIEDRRKKAADRGLDPDVVEDIWEVLHDYFVNIENKIIAKKL